MFDFTNIQIPQRVAFRNAYDAFRSNFSVRVKGEERKYILKTFNSIEKDFYEMEKEANKIIYDPKDRRLVRSVYESDDFINCVEAADKAGVFLSIPDHLVAEEA